MLNFATWTRFTYISKLQSDKSPLREGFIFAKIADPRIFAKIKHLRKFRIYSSVHEHVHLFTLDFILYENDDFVLIYLYDNI